MKKQYIIRIVLWAVLAVVLTGVLLSFFIVPHKDFTDFSLFNINLLDLKLNFGSTIYADYDKENSYNIGNAEINMDIKSLSVNWISGDVHFIAYSGETIKIKENAVDEIEESHKLRWKIEKEALTIQPCASGKMPKGSRKLPAKTLQIYIPYSIAENLTNAQIETVSANININPKFKLENLNATTVSGDIFAETLYCEDINLETASGSVLLTDVYAKILSSANVSGNTEITGDIKELRTEAVSGKTYFSATKAPEKIFAESVSGSITAHLPKEDGFTLTHETVSGGFKTSFDLQAENGKKVYKNGENAYSIETVSGSVYLNANSENQVVEIVSETSK